MLVAINVEGAFVTAVSFGSHMAFSGGQLEGTLSGFQIRSGVGPSGPLFGTVQQLPNLDLAAFQAIIVGPGSNQVIGNRLGEFFLGGNDHIIGATAADKLFGFSGNDVIRGGAGYDLINGGAGNDQLVGGLGRDTMLGGAGRDSFVFDVAPTAGNADRIVGFSTVDDRILLDDDAFTQLRGNTGSILAEAAFSTGTAATTAAHRIIFDAATDRLFYDADGVGGRGQVLIATVVGADIQANDILIVA
jgi:Ca2+-binding RTX toxin-like protein